MQKLLHLLLVSFIASTAFMANLSWADTPPVNNAVPPCDHSAVTRKPPCNTDSDSIKVPPETPQQKRVREKGVVVPPEMPAEGLPNREHHRAPTRKEDAIRPDPHLEKPMTN
ncbi:hypothetical protein [Methylophilus aquaticus]|uniref:Uncharacterized protein n=1 Tax=Methylophilus aquaticus TaxID=1971610 RepID=A0ABT9JRV9_9PROT|nr:hypothetical protein [Methylophilus aquaticus]MDP8567303.1 hypothetical protein [Methylophilus aquaticus]